MADTTKEMSLNGKLAEELRKKGLDAVEEQTIKSASGRRHQVDVLVNLDEYVVALEAEFAPSDGKADASKRLTSPPLQWHGIPVEAAYAIRYPEQLKNTSPPRSYKKLKDTQALQFVHRTRSNKAWSSPVTGDVAKLADVLHDYWTRSDSGQAIDHVVILASSAIDRAASVLNRYQPEIGERNSDPAATKALVWLNALLFQILLSESLDPSTLPEPHTGKRILHPNPDKGVQNLLAQWDEILEINWFSIFDVARESLRATTPRAAKLAITILNGAASNIAETGVIRQHDVAGRIFHQLLETRKFLATNYTTIPAAIILAALAFDRKHPTWKGVNFGDKRVLENLKIVDPACGSGTLLMAAFQEMLKHIQHENRQSSALRKCILENSLFGFDVVPAAIHLAASTLSMAETSQLISDMKLWRMQYGVSHSEDTPRARLGSLDMLLTSPSRGNAMQLPLLEAMAGTRVSGTGERSRTSITFPEHCDLVIANPPYTRAGGPGDDANTDWNPIFGALLDKRDRKLMDKALKTALLNTPAGIYPGLGSAFIVLADENVRHGGRIAFVLPNAVITGSSWKQIRARLLADYQIDWVIASHDPGSRTAQAGLPGRLYVSFSESTNMGEVLLVATHGRAKRSHKVRFVNFSKNPRTTIDAIAVARALLEAADKQIDLSTPATSWGQVHTVPQRALTAETWVETSFVQSSLITAAHDIRDSKNIPLCPLGADWRFGPYEMQIKNPKQGLFSIDENLDSLRSGYPALWHHKAKLIKHLSASPNAFLTPRPDKSSAAQKRMLGKASKLHYARELRTNTQRLAAVITDKPILGVRSWISLKPAQRKAGSLETLCLWFNSTPGLIMRLIHANQPYPGRSLITHTAIQSLCALDVFALTSDQLQQGKSYFRQISKESLRPFHKMEKDSTRKKIDLAICNILGLDPDAFSDIRNQLVKEPLINAGKGR